MRLGIYVVLLFAACAASGQTAPALPGTIGAGEPLPAPVVPEPGKPAAAPQRTRAPGRCPNDPGGDADFAAAKARFEPGDRRGRARALEAFEAHHPDHGARRPPS